MNEKTEQTEQTEQADKTRKIGKVRHYTDDRIDVSYDAARCIHAAECVRRLPAVFDTARRPWILPSGGDADRIAAVVARCPTGALHFTRLDGGPAEPPPDRNVVVPMPNGPLYVRGRLQVRSADDEVTVVEDVRVALCRCGQSRNKPFCDNSHLNADFVDPGAVTAGSAGSAGSAASDASGGPLSINATLNGPLVVEGAFTLRTRDGRTEHHAVKATLCRCGASARKPFCDGSHRRIGFVSARPDDTAS
jgi:CDGSH-type Zn-finger protein/uncharacterized Fe-S cluster protein YjdI